MKSLRHLFFCFLCGIFSTAHAQETEVAATPMPLSVPDEATSTTSAPVDYNKFVARIQHETEKIRGIAMDEDIEPNVLTREELGKLLQQMLAEEMEKPGAQELIVVMKMLDLIPEDVSIETTYQNLLEGQVGGLYNPADGSLYVVDTFDPRGFIGSVILSHEIGHALQDKAHDLQTFLLDEENLDRQKAKQAVVEGDATVLMIEWGADHFTAAVLLELTTLLQQQTQDLAAVPQVIVQDLLFAYLGGAEFSTAVQQAHPKKWRTMIFEDPPSSSEQILHPEKYLAEERDEPVDLQLREVPEDHAYEEIFRNTMGEWAIRLFLTPPDRFPRITAFTLNPMVNDPESVLSAAGWGGDQIVLLRKKEKPEEQMLVWSTAWDTHEDAQEFFQAAVRRLEVVERFGAPERFGFGHDPARAAVSFSKGEQPVMVEQSWKRVDIILAPQAGDFNLARILLPRKEPGPDLLDKDFGVGTR